MHDKYVNKRLTNLATKAAFIEDGQLFWFGIGSVLYQHSLFQWTTNDCVCKSGKLKPDWMHFKNKKQGDIRLCVENVM